MTRLVRAAAFALLAACAGLGAAGCATWGPRPATLQVRCNVPEATLWLDDAFAGRVSEWGAGLPLGPGFRRIEIRHPGYFTFFAEVEPREAEAIALEAELRREPD